MYFFSRALAPQKAGTQDQVSKNLSLVSNKFKREVKLASVEGTKNAVSTAAAPPQFRRRVTSSCRAPSPSWSRWSCRLTPGPSPPSGGPGGTLPPTLPPLTLPSLVTAQTPAAPAATQPSRWSPLLHLEMGGHSRLLTKQKGPGCGR
jgi:hypothetical protein